MKVKIQHTVRIVQEVEMDAYPGSTPEQIVREVIERDGEDRWESVCMYVQESVPTSFMTTCQVIGDDDIVVAQGSVHDKPSQTDIGYGDMAEAPEIKDGEFVH